MGTDTNVRKRLVAMHHLDAPWMPAEVERRDGRATPTSAGRGVVRCWARKSVRPYGRGHRAGDSGRCRAAAQLGRMTGMKSRKVRHRTPTSLSLPDARLQSLK